MSGRRSIASIKVSTYHGTVLQSRTNIFGDILENIRLETHLHIHSAGDPAKLALPDIQHPVDSLGGFASNHSTIPRGGGNLFDGGLDPCESEKVHVAILLLIGSLLVQCEAVQGFVGVCDAGRSCVGGISVTLASATGSYDMDSHTKWTYEGV